MLGLSLASDLPVASGFLAQDFLPEPWKPHPGAKNP